MPAQKAVTGAGGFSAEERAAMKERAAELRAEGKKGAKAADGLQAVLDGIAEMAPEDRALAERVHMTVTATAPELSPKTRRTSTTATSGRRPTRCNAGAPPWRRGSSRW